MDSTKKTRLRKLWALLLCVAMVFSLLPTTWQTETTKAATTYTLVENEADIVTGDYILVDSSGYAIGTCSGGYAVSQYLEDRSDASLANCYQWTIEVTGSTALIKMNNGAGIQLPRDKSKEGIYYGDVASELTIVTSSAISSGLQVEFKTDTHYLAQAIDTKNDADQRFRFFKSETVYNGDGTANTKYDTKFTLYKVASTIAKKPNASVASGAVASGSTIALTTNTEGATIKYAKVTGANPTQPDKSAFQTYSEAITIDQACTIYAYAAKDGLEDSDVASFTYTILKAPLESGTYFLYSKSGNGLMAHPDKGGIVAATLNAENKVVFGENTDSGNGAAIYAVTKNEDGYYTITCGGKYLTGTTTNSSSTVATLEDTIQDSASSSSYWTVKASGDGYTVVNKVAVDKYNNLLALEYYKDAGNVTLYKQGTADYYVFQFIDASSYAATDTDGWLGERPVEVNPLSSGTYFIWHKDAAAAKGGVMKYEMTGGVAADVAATISGENISFGEDTNNGEGAGYYEITRQDDGTYLIKCGTKYVSSDSDKNLYLSDSPVNTSSNGSYWKITWNEEFGGYFIANASTKLMMEYYGSKGFCLWDAGKTAIYVFKFANAKTYADADTDHDGYLGVMPKMPEQPESGKTYVIYNATGGSVMGAELPSVDGSKRTMGMAAAALGEDGALNVANGGLIFTAVKDAEGYYTLENNGKYLVTGPAEGLCLMDPNSAADKQAFADENEGTEYKEGFSKWDIQPRLGGVLLKNKDAKWKSSVIYIEYFSGGFAGYSFKANDAGIFTFEFHEAEDTYGTGYVVNPSVIFNESNGDANLGLDYETKFTLNDLGEIQSVKVTVTFEDNSSKNYTPSHEGYDYSFTIQEADLAGHSSFTTKVEVVSQETATQNAEYSGTATVQIKDEPVITNVSPASNEETGANKRPTIEIAYVNIGAGATATLTLNGEAVALTQNTANNTFSYTPATDMYDGKVTAVATITRADGKTTTKTWNFYIGQAGVHAYFGQIHSHTAEYSDGSGTLEDAYNSAMAAKDSDYTIVTDHSNYFDTTSTAVKESIYDAGYASIDKSPTVVDGKTLNKWEEAKATAAEYNAMSNDFVAAYGYEMTWSGGPGHINVFNSAGIVSRNNTELNDKTNNKGMFAFYDLLVDANDKNATSLGTGSISAMFNHPGTTFGFFDSFTGLTEERDEVMNLIEVGNGDGAVGSTSYFPSYEYYDMALSVGWHIAPTNGQDNHKGGWGSINTMRTVVLTDSFTEAGIYEAMAARHIYSTEDQNLTVLYHLDDTLQGGIIDGYDKDTVKIAVTLSDGDTKENLGTVYVIGENGAELNS